MARRGNKGRGNPPRLFISNSTLVSKNGQGMSIDDPNLIVSMTDSTILSKLEAIDAPRVRKIDLFGVKIPEMAPKRKPTKKKSLEGYCPGYSIPRLGKKKD